MKYLGILLITIGLLTCNGTKPPPDPPALPDPPVTTTTTSPAPTPTLPRPSDYYTLARAGTYTIDASHCREHTGMIQDICYDLCPWACWRDPAYVADMCPWSCADGNDPMFDLTVGEMITFSGCGATLNQEGTRWMEKLPQINRRCATDDRFCGRSDVRRTNYTDGTIPAFKQWRVKSNMHKEKAYAMRDLAQTDPIRKTCSYDSVRGFCQCRNNE